MSTPQPGGSGGEEASSEAGGKSEEDKEGRRARFLHRLSLARPKLRLPRPPLRRGGPSAASPPPVVPPPTGPEPTPPEGSKPPEEPKGSRELLFRAKTRLRAIGYWLREKGQVAWRGLKRARGATAAWWSMRSRGTRMRIFAAAGIVVLYLIVKFAPVPGVPCGISTAKECAPSNDTIAYVPQNAVLYAHLTVNSDSHQWELTQNLRDALPNFTALLQSDTSDLAGPAGKPIDLSREVLPWAKDDLALLGVPGPNKTTPEAYITGVGDTTKANQFAASLSPGGKSKQSKLGDATLTVYSNGVATARSGDQLVFGALGAVRAAVAAKSGQLPALEGSDQNTARDELPDVRVAEVVSLTARRATVPGRTSGRRHPARHLCRLRGDQRDGRVREGARRWRRGDVVSELDPELEQQSPTVFATLPRFDPGLADEAGPRALGYVGVGDLGPAITKALVTAGAGAQGLAGSLRGLAQRLQQQAGVDPLKDLLPALGGQAALVAEPTNAAPYASLIVDDVDEKQAGDALAALQRPLLRSLRTGGPQVPSFQSREIDGVDGPLAADLARRGALLCDLRRQAGDFHPARGDRASALERRHPGRLDRLSAGRRWPPRSGLGASLPQPR